MKLLRYTLAHVVVCALAQAALAQSHTVSETVPGTVVPRTEVPLPPTTIVGGDETTRKPVAVSRAKRVRPPKPGTRKRITVRIEPDVAPLRIPAKKADADGGEKAGSVQPGRYSWFWDRVSPDLAKSSPGRLEPALVALSSQGRVDAPRLQTLRDIAAARAVPILTATVGTRVSPALVLAVIAVESAGKVDAVSPVGAQGLMQLMPETAQQFDVDDSLSPDQNIAGGVRYLDWLMREFDGDPILVLAGYNAGPGAVRKHGGVPPFSETRDYVPKVLAAFRVARALCKTPPELISDGCVFATGS